MTEQIRKRRDEAQKWYAIVLANCESLARDWANESTVCAAEGLSDVDRVVHQTTERVYDRSLAQCLSPLLAKHQVPENDRPQVLAKLRELRGGKETTESIAILIPLYGG